MAVLPSGDGHPVPLGAAGCKFSAASCGLSPGLASAPPRRGFCKTICALTSASLGPSITQAAPSSSSGLALCGDGEPRLEQGGGAGRGPRERKALPRNNGTEGTPHSLKTGPVSWTSPAYQRWRLQEVGVGFK